MKTLTECDIFKSFDKATNTSHKMALIAERIIDGGNKDVKVLSYSDFEVSLAQMKRYYKTPEIIKMIEDIKAKKIILYYTSNPQYNMPPCIPFFKFNSAKGPITVINTTNYISIKKLDKNGDEVDYSMDTKILYTLVQSAFYQQNVFEKRTALGTEASGLAAIIWARMVNQILIRSFGISSDKERCQSLLYFEMKFFLINILEMNPVTAEKIAIGQLNSKYFANGKNYMITEIENKLSDRNVDPYVSLEDFIMFIFDNEYTRIRTIGGKNQLASAGKLDVGFFVKRFISTYYDSAIMALGCMPYFLFTLLAASNWAYINAVKQFEDIIKGESQQDFQKLLVNINKML